MAPTGLFKLLSAWLIGPRSRSSLSCAAPGAGHRHPEPAGRWSSPSSARWLAASERQAERLDELAKELDFEGRRTAQDPRTRLAEELRELARQLRDKPTDLDVNLARLGAMEAEVRVADRSRRTSSGPRH